MRTQYERRIVMKRMILSLALVVLPIVACETAMVLAQGQPANPVTTRPAGWRMTGDNPDGYEVAVVDTIKHGGKYSASLRAGSKAVNDKFGSLVQAIRPDNFRGRRVRLSSFVKTDSVEGFAAMWIRIDGPNMEMLDFSNMGEKSIKGTTNWAKYDLVVDVPANAEAIVFGAMLGGAKGQMWVDDITLEAVGANIAKTSNPVSEQDRREAEEYAKQIPKDEIEKTLARYRGLPVTPQNLDFEQAPVRRYSSQKAVRDTQAIG